MIAPNTIKIDGKWYHAGDELPSGFPETPQEPWPEKRKIQHMRVDALRELAGKIGGIEGYETKSAPELKFRICEILGY